MKKLFNIWFVLTAFLFLLVLRQEAFAFSSGKMMVLPVDIPTIQTSLGVYPNALDMVANDIINYLNKNSSYEVPDLNTARALIKSYGLQKDYKNFLMNYRDNMVLDYETCNRIRETLGIEKLLLVSGGFDTQNLFLDDSGSQKWSQISSTVLPFARIFSKDLVFAGLPYIGSNIYNSVKDTPPVNPSYMFKVHVALIDTNSGLAEWEKTYNKKIEVSNFGSPLNSFGQNLVASDKIKKFSEKMSKKVSEELSKLDENTEYTSVKGTIVPASSLTNTKAVPRDGKMTRDGHPSSVNNSNEKYLESLRKQNYKNWVKERVKK